MQALLARHPAVLTLPETAFFEQLCGGLEWRWGDEGARAPRRKWRRRLGFVSKGAHDRLMDLQRAQTGATQAWWATWRTRQCAREFVDLLDRQAAALGHSTWLEKTPYHLLYIPQIERWVEGARFIHVIRRGEDVLASVADANMRFDGNGAFGGGTVLWSRRWNRAAEIHQLNSGRPNHHFIFLEDLIADMDAEWKRLCTFLALDPDASLEHVCDQDVADVAHEPWKQGATSGIPCPTKGKAAKMFGPQVRQWLQENLQPYDDLRRSCISREQDRHAARTMWRSSSSPR